MKWAEDAQRTKQVEDTQSTEWIDPAGMLGSKDQKNE